MGIPKHLQAKNLAKTTIEEYHRRKSPSLACSEAEQPWTKEAFKRGAEKIIALADGDFKDPEKIMLMKTAALELTLEGQIYPLPQND